MASSSPVRPRQRPAYFANQRAQSLYRPRGLVKHHEYRYWTASNLSELPASLTPPLICARWLAGSSGPCDWARVWWEWNSSPSNTVEPTMPEPGSMAVTGSHASEGTVTLLTPTEDKLANLGEGGSPRRRVPPGLAALAAQFPGLRVE